MLDLQTVHHLMVQSVPFNQVLGIAIKTIAPTQVEVILPETSEHLNHVGTIHAAAQFGLGEAASGTMIVVAFGDLLEKGSIPLAAKATITYRKAARGELRGVARLSQEEQVRIREEIIQTGRVRFSVLVQLEERDGTLLTELEVFWTMLKP